MFSSQVQQTITQTKSAGVGFDFFFIVHAFITQVYNRKDNYYLPFTPS